MQVANDGAPRGVLGLVKSSGPRLGFLVRRAALEHHRDRVGRRLHQPVVTEKGSVQPDDGERLAITGSHIDQAALEVLGRAGAVAVDGDVGVLARAPQPQLKVGITQDSTQLITRVNQ